MNKITMYDMGFGDAHILEKEEDKTFHIYGFGFNNFEPNKYGNENCSNEKLLVDFGSNNSKKDSIAKHSVPDVKNVVENGNISFLLTHFHKDHYNQLKNLPKKCFKNIYIRNIYDSTVTIYRSIFELMLYRKYSSRWNNALSTILAYPHLNDYLKKNGYFVFVRKGSTFSINGETYKVYKPELTNDFFQPFKLEEEAANVFVQKVKKEIDIIVNFVKDNIFSEGTISYLSNEATRNQTFSNVLKAAANIQKLANEYNVILSGSSKSKLSKFVKSSDEHKYNIIFGLEDHKSSMRLLMCGDAYPKDVEDVVKTNEIQHIKVLKAPHHGTPAYFPNLTGVTIDDVLIPYSYHTHSCKGYVIDARYSATPYANMHTPKKELNY